MGVEPFLVSSAVILIVAQRLVRKICNNCKKPEKLPVQVFIEAGFTAEEAASVISHKGTGCEVCNQTGYKGRIALDEVMPIKDRNQRTYPAQGASVFDIKRQAITGGTKTLRRSGLLKVKSGMTSLERSC